MGGILFSPVLGEDGAFKDNWRLVVCSSFLDWDVDALEIHFRINLVRHWVDDAAFASLIAIDFTLSFH